MNDIISLYIGQGGIRIGQSVWELYCLDHGLSPDGGVLDHSDQNRGQEFKSFFTESQSGKYIPNAIMVDLEPTTIDEIRVGKNKDLFCPDFLLVGKEDAGNNFARGFNSVGKEERGKVMERVRRLVEGSDHFQGLILHEAQGGGTGSGFGARLCSILTEMYPKKGKLEFTIYPTPEMSSCVVDPYNTVLATSMTMEDIECTIISDNEALYDMCKENLDIDLPKFSNLNLILAQAVSAVTGTFRFEGSLNGNLHELQTNLVPYPRIHFPLLTLSPIISPSMIEHERSNFTGTTEITKACFTPHHQMVKCAWEKATYVSCCLYYRGDVTSADVSRAISVVKERKKLRFLDWSPTGIKVGINPRPPVVIPKGNFAETQRSVCMIANMSAIKDTWVRLNKKFSIMFKRKCFLHWYLNEGLELSEMTEAQQNIATLISDYNSLTKIDVDEF